MILPKINEALICTILNVEEEVESSYTCILQILSRRCFCLNEIPKLDRSFSDEHGLG